ncbi:protein ALTERED PHOSPHATE STARVATION RESPONSE 1 [Sesamum alatum]|uniref:Protein ALTERED PHOSPHATE STARVATION RESPONSE 1 n=1 Tax=Sesamum alatum TaxID=300844 RepID=A0AAE1Y5G8_9LAMI|nr:protein ALTERED PHOSPHATE STARVATION RESPONSE 1 [Sesamum alatum]
MGCATSKLDDLPAVSLCRHRCAFLDEAVRHRFAFAQAHAAYLHSLKAVGLSLHRFFNHDLHHSALVPTSPVLNLPPQTKGDTHPPLSPPQHHLHSRSHSAGSHLHFHSDSDDDDRSRSDSLNTSSPVHQKHPYGGYVPQYGNLNLNPNPNLPGPGGGGEFLSYMKNQMTPSLLYTQRPMSQEAMHVGEFSSSSYYLFPDYQNPPLSHNNTSNNNYNGYPNYGPGGTTPPAPYGAGFSSPAEVASSSRAPPPPPSPPKSSTWDFLNPFGTFERDYQAYTPSHDSREVREEEGIPDLEDENDEVVKEVLGDRKFVDSGRNSHSKPGAQQEDARVVNDADLQHRARPSAGMESDPVEYEVHMMYKNAVDTEKRSKDRGNATGFKPRGGFKGDAEVVKEIQVQFERASESGSELAKFLEVGKLPYKQKHSSHRVTSMMLHLPVASSLPPVSESSDNVDPAFLDVGEDVELRSKNLSSTLHKLYLWEKKLYEEVKVEEKMRILHERKSRKLKRLDEGGAEANKVDATKTLVRSLSTKIKIAIQVVDKISVRINSLRDEELWPQLNDFIQGLTRMFKSMLECHRNQCQAIGEAKQLDAIALRKHLSDAHFEATSQLEHDLINWTLGFSYWVDAQKGYVRALNNWLMKCLLYIPEETSDGIVPFSPGRIGAPPVFVVCNQWSQSLDRISEKDVVDSMREFASNVLHLWDQDKAEMRKRMLANKDERKIKSLEKEDQKIQKEIQALDKRMVLISAADNGMPLTGRAVYQSETSKGGSLHASLQHVLEAMERFTANSLKVYEELLQRIEEDDLAREHKKSRGRGKLNEDSMLPDEFRTVAVLPYRKGKGGNTGNELNSGGCRCRHEACDIDSLEMYRKAGQWWERDIA